MNYKDYLPDNFVYNQDRERLLDLLKYFHDEGYTYKQAQRIMELAGPTMRRAAMDGRV